MNHGFVMLGDWKIPLIGIAPTETSERCDSCGEQTPLQWVIIQSADRILCLKCAVDGPEDSTIAE